MCYKRDLHDLLENASEVDSFDLMDWYQRIEDIFKERGKQELVFLGHEKCATNSGNTSVYNCNFI